MCNFDSNFACVWHLFKIDSVVRYPQLQGQGSIMTWGGPTQSGKSEV